MVCIYTKHTNLNERRIAQYPMDIVTSLLQIALISLVLGHLFNSLTNTTDALTAWINALARLISVIKQFFTKNKK